jgi:hypothetical protein
LFYKNMKGPCLCLCLYLWEEDGGFIHSENVKEFFRVVAYIFRYRWMTFYTTTSPTALYRNKVYIIILYY